MNELIEILRGMADMLDGPQNAGNLVVPAIISRFRESANVIERLETENAALREEIATAERQLRQRNAMNAEQAKCIDRLISERDGLREQLAEKSKKIERYQQWVNDLQSGMYVNCVYCGHRYGPADTTPVSMAEVLKQHVEQCPEHPMSQLKADLARVSAERDAAIKRTKRLCYLEHGGYCDTDNKPCDGCESKWRSPLKEDGRNDN